jgi:hypothetical protein
VERARPRWTLEEAVRPAPTKPAGWKGAKGETFWTKNSRHGVRYKCQTCGCERLGYGRNNHYDDCTSAAGREEYLRGCRNEWRAIGVALQCLGRNLAMAGALAQARLIGEAHAVRGITAWLMAQFQKRTVRRRNDPYGMAAEGFASDIRAGLWRSAEQASGDGKP